jgi:hypothetical protein
LAISFIASEEAETTATSVTVPVPAGTANGDVMLLTSCCGDSDGQGTDTPATPSGWTLVTGPIASAATGASTPTVTVYRRVASSEPANYAVGGTVDCGRHGTILTFRGVDTTTPIDATSTTATGTGNNPDPASITVATTGAAVVAIGFMDNADGANLLTGAPSGYTLAEEGVALNDEASNGGRVGVAYQLGISSGAHNPATFSGSAASEQWGAITVALRPAGAAGATLTVALTAQSATVAATLSRGRTLAPALTAQSASVSATLSRGRTLAPTLAAQSATVAATLSRGRTLAPALTAQAASVSATLSITELNELTVALQAQSATIDVDLRRVQLVGSYPSGNQTISLTAQGESRIKRSGGQQSITDTSAGNNKITFTAYGPQEIEEV